MRLLWLTLVVYLVSNYIMNRDEDLSIDLTLFAPFMPQALPAFPCFDLDSDLASLDSRWEKYIRRFENLLVAIYVKDDARKKASLLYYDGEKAQDVFETFVNHDQSTFPERKKALTEHFQPKHNLSYEVFNFRKANQHEDETVDLFALRLRELSAHCEFHDVERELKSQIELGTTNKRVQRYAFRSPDLTLEDLLLYARTLEHTALQAKDIEHAPSPRHAAEVQKVTPYDKPFSTQSQKRKPY